MFGSIGFTELILVLFIVLIIFGAGKLPQLGEGLGKAIKGFKKSVHEAESVEAETPPSESAPSSQPQIAVAQAAAPSPMQMVMPEPQAAGLPPAAKA